MTSLIADEDFASEMEEMFERDFAHAVLIDQDIMQKKSFWWRLGVNVSRLAAPLL